MAEEPGAGGDPPEEPEEPGDAEDAEDVEHAPDTGEDAGESDDSRPEEPADASPITGQAPDSRPDPDANPITGRAPTADSADEGHEESAGEESAGEQSADEESAGEASADEESADEDDEGEIEDESEPQLSKEDDESKSQLSKENDESGGSDEEAGGETSGEGAEETGSEEPGPEEPPEPKGGPGPDDAPDSKRPPCSEASAESDELPEPDEDDEEDADDEDDDEKTLEDLAAQGPPDDEEMPLADHIEEMIKRLAIVCAVAAVVATGVFFIQQPGPARALSQEMIMFIWDSVLPDDELADPRVYGPLELKLTELKFASLIGFVVALPVFVYETYRFMRPGLYPNERRYYLAAIPTSLVLAFIGVAFAFYVLLPVLFQFFMEYSEAAGTISFALGQTFNLILILMGYLALVFQIPLFIMLAIMMGLTTRRWLEEKRLYFWAAFLGISFLVLPEPTGMAPLMATVTMIALYEGTLALLRWTGN